MRRSKLGIMIALLVSGVVLAAYTATIASITSVISSSGRAEMTSLVSAGEDFKRGVGERAEGAMEIERSVLAAAEPTRTNRDDIEDVSKVARTFKTA